MSPSRILLSLILFALLASPARSQDQKAPVKLFLDCGFGCDQDYIRREIPFVEYVRDRTDADVHLLVSIQESGGGGRSYQLDFIGQGRFGDTNQSLVYASGTTDTSDERRAGLVRKLKLGLLQYVSTTALADQIDIVFAEREEEAEGVGPADDPWNQWIFEVEVEGDYEAEEQEQNYEFQPSFSAERVTEAWKLEFSSYVELRIDRFEVDNRTITNDQTSGEVEGLVVKSLSDHWSAGGFAQVRTSTFSNIDLQVLAAPALEYNLFPYQESSRKQLRFIYRLNTEHVNYADTTIYNKAQETLLSQSLGIAAEIQQPWGDINASAMYLQYVHDFEFNRLDFDARIDVRLFRGLELSLGGEASAIHDQLSLPRGGASEEDVLLRRRELATSFQLELSVGITYTFGSIFNSVVNPRFGDGF